MGKILKTTLINAIVNYQHKKQHLLYDAYYHVQFHSNAFCIRRPHSPMYIFPHPPLQLCYLKY